MFDFVEENPSSPTTETTITTTGKWNFYEQGKPLSKKI